MRAADAASWRGDGAGGGGGATPQPFRPFQGYLSFGRWGETGNVRGKVLAIRGAEGPGCRQPSRGIA